MSWTLPLLQGLGGAVSGYQRGQQRRREEDRQARLDQLQEMATLGSILQQPGVSVEGPEAQQPDLGAWSSLPDSLGGEIARELAKRPASAGRGVLDAAGAVARGDGGQPQPQPQQPGPPRPVPTPGGPIASAVLGASIGARSARGVAAAPAPAGPVGPNTSPPPGGGSALSNYLRRAIDEMSERRAGAERQSPAGVRLGEIGGRGVYMDPTRNEGARRWAEQEAVAETQRARAEAERSEAQEEAAAERQAQEARRQVWEQFRRTHSDLPEPPAVITDEVYKSLVDMVARRENQDHEWQTLHYREGQMNARAAAARAGGNGGGAGGGGGISTGTKREYDYWQRIADNYIAAADGSVDGALAMIHQNPEHRAARTSGDISIEMLRAAAARHRDGTKTPDLMSFEEARIQLEQLDEWESLNPVQRREAIQRYRRGQEPFPATGSPRPSATLPPMQARPPAGRNRPGSGSESRPAEGTHQRLSPQDAAQARNSVAGMRRSEAERILAQDGFTPEQIQQILPPSGPRR